MAMVSVGMMVVVQNAISQAVTNTLRQSRIWIHLQSDHIKEIYPAGQRVAARLCNICRLAPPKLYSSTLTKLSLSRGFMPNLAILPRED